MRIAYCGYQIGALCTQIATPLALIKISSHLLPLNKALKLSINYLLLMLQRGSINFNQIKKKPVLTI